LVISEKLVRLMGGEHIDLASQPEQGTCFSFALPCQTCVEPPDTHQAEESADSSSQAASDAAVTPLEGNILLVEDNPVNQEVAKAMLKALGLVPETVDGGEQAVTACRNQSFDLILMDIQMPGMDGYEATRRIRELDAQVPIIALTAAALIEDKDKALNAGMNDHLAKPIDFPVLARTLTRYLTQSVAAQRPGLVVWAPQPERIKPWLPALKRLVRVHWAPEANTVAKRLANPGDIAWVAVDAGVSLEEAQSMKARYPQADWVMLVASDADLADTEIEGWPLWTPDMLVNRLQSNQ
jgi:CheY-like chemotaxis protein